MYKQLSLTGEENDILCTTDEVKGGCDLVDAIEVFYRNNNDINPRQLHYLIESESFKTHLAKMLENRFNSNNIIIK